MFLQATETPPAGSAAQRDEVRLAAWSPGSWWPPGSLSRGELLSDREPA
ncbi:hypothetical protein [Actinoplanes siamensis]|nr:hypothetical protein [Actinoplanes siamensis]